MDEDNLHGQIGCAGGIRYFVSPAKADTAVIVLIHGLAESLEHWLPLAADLQSHHQVIAFDLPGSGRSAKVPKLTRSKLLDCLVDLLQALAPTGQYILIAHSFGVIAVCDLAARLEQRIKSVVLIDATLFRASQAIHWKFRSFSELAFTIRMWSLISAAHIPFTRWWANLLAGSVALRSILLRHVLHRPEEVPAERLRRALRYSGRANGLDHVRIALETDYCDLVRQVQCPIWLIAGENDWVVEKIDIEVTQGLAKVLGTSSIPECGHWSIIERPSELASFIEQAVDR